MTTMEDCAAVRQDAVALLAAYESGRWVPEHAERELAEGLAMGQWTGPFFRASLRNVPPAVRLIDVLARPPRSWTRPTSTRTSYASSVS
ncbi:hypothetical protein OIE52_01715 [Streptomyces canus]|uniref:hypothetical protein n=1 Tax=Streptomyces canus TaxID=58343 RepID=UPI0030E3EF0E